MIDKKTRYRRKAIRFSYLFSLLMALVFLLGSCVSSEEDFCTEYPPPSSYGHCPSETDIANVNEGFFTSPLWVGDAPISRISTVGGYGSSYYEFNTGSGSWLVEISKLETDADLGLYPDDTFSNSGNYCISDNYGTSPDSCYFNCFYTSCSGFIKISSLDIGGTSFTLTVD